MQAQTDTLDLNPPLGGHWRGPLVLALVVHALLVLALTWGVSWQRDRLVVAEAELWSALPQAAAPRAVAPEPPAPPTPTPPTPQPRPSPPPPPATAPPRDDAQIALEQKRAQQERERQRQLQQQAAAEKAAQQQAAREKATREQAARERAQAAQAAQAAQRQAAQLEAQRQQNLARMLGQAGASGGPTATGSAERASGPSASYAGRLVASIRPNIVFTELLSANPVATVEVRTLPDGTVLGSKLLKSSGVAAWDTAVLRAVERTGRLPRDENGRVPNTLILDFRPRD
jgi:colicin import membrane protein